MRHNRSLALLAAALTIPLFGCSDSTWLPLEPAAAPSAPSSPAPDPAFPTVGDTAQVYVRVSPSTFVEGTSRYVLYSDGTFGLQYVTPRFGFFQYKGRYARTGSAIVFDWDGWSTAGPWGAEGAIAGDSLTVKYNVVMMLSDFEDGVYVRSSGGK